MNDQIYNMLIQKDEITWQSLLLDLIKSEQMNPWDIDITLLTKRYIDTIRKMQEANFFISGKVLLASALLLKIKSNKLVNEEIYNFDSQLFKQEETYEELEELFDQAPNPGEQSRPKLTIKTPMPRKRKVTLQDLMTALNKALETEKRRNVKRELLNRIDVKLPEKKIDISELISGVYSKIVEFFKTKEKLTFTQLVNSDKKEDLIYTFIPLLHLATQEKIDLNQNENFGEIDIAMYQKDRVL
ncbi:segregation/condensation protein A [Candidatus Woesearchaeota archaeon]|nr:segregation/condensation protein A [Candidatus Woesearchaeota archaeon]